MMRFIGHADIPGACLRYYVFGSRRQGYGIKISRSQSDFAALYVSRNLFTVLNLANQLCRCQVFPCSLSEILDDLKYSVAAD